MCHPGFPPYDLASRGRRFALLVTRAEEVFSQQAPIEAARVASGGGEAIKRHHHAMYEWVGRVGPKPR
ncbi:hypothetical protein L1049_005256 [Liquidambar formosana]|uniref:Uncharacterized protein n=1 Tax=Liquidambar formosana TaxID=63359 RepID=A0AAP0X1E8_LIQFO